MSIQVCFCLEDRLAAIFSKSDLLQQELWTFQAICVRFAIRCEEKSQPCVHRRSHTLQVQLSQAANGRFQRRSLVSETAPGVIEIQPLMLENEELYIEKKETVLIGWAKPSKPFNFTRSLALAFGDTTRMLGWLGWLGWLASFTCQASNIGLVGLQLKRYVGRISTPYEKVGK